MGCGSSKGSHGHEAAGADESGAGGGGALQPAAERRCGGDCGGCAARKLAAAAVAPAPAPEISAAAPSPAFAWNVALAGVLFMLVNAGEAAAQCAMCKRALESGGGDGLIRGFYWSIVLLLSMPPLLIGGVAFALWRAARNKRAGPAEIGAGA